MIVFDSIAEAVESSPAEVLKAAENPSPSVAGNDPPISPDDVPATTSGVAGTQAEPMPVEAMDYSAEVAKRLSPEHLAELRSSGLTDKTIVDGNIRTVTDPDVVARCLASPGGQSFSRPLAACLALPYWNADGKPLRVIDPYATPQPDGKPATMTYVVMKPSTPRVGREGKIVKYETPAGMPAEVCFMPGFAAAMRDKSATIIVTEGMKKGYAAAQLGLPVIALSGVWNFTKPRPHDDKGRTVGKAELHSSLAAVDWSGRKVAVVFDSDAAEKANVLMAEASLVELLNTEAVTTAMRLNGDKPCTAFAVRLPAGDKGCKVGLDDFL